jgi:hypothetical protein
MAYKIQHRKFLRWVDMYPNPKSALYSFTTEGNAQAILGWLIDDDEISKYRVVPMQTEASTIVRETLLTVAMATLGLLWFWLMVYLLFSFE